MSKSSKSNSVKAASTDPALDPSRQAVLGRASTAKALALIEQASHPGRFPRQALLDLLRKDSDLDPIRNTDDYRALLARLSR